MIIYTDLDYVLHHYTPDMLDVCHKLFGPFDISVSDCNRLSKAGPFDYAKKEIPLTDEMINQAVYVVDRDRARWLPTQWGGVLANALIERMDEFGDEVRVITARSTWRNAGQVVREIFGRDLPLFTCSSHHKHLIIDDNSIYFEDTALIVNNVLNKNKNSIVIYPVWTWNLGKIDKDVENRSIPMRENMWESIPGIIESAKRRIENGSKR